MVRPVDVPVRSSSRLELFPLAIANDGAEYLVGRRGGAYLAVSSAGLEAISLLGEGMPVGRVKQLLATKYAADAVLLEPLLQQLLSAELLQAVDDRRIHSALDVRRARQPVLTRHQVAWLFGQRAIHFYIAVLALAIVAVMSDPSVLPHPRVLLDGGWRTALLSLALTLIIAAKHEFAHVAAGRFLGVDARCQLGYRLFFPVVETDLSDLWLVPSRQRYLAYVAGVASDLLLACLAVIALWAQRRGWIWLPPNLHHVLELTSLIVGCLTVWQLNVFLRTDGYYILSNALGHRNLADDAKAYLRRVGRNTRAGERDMAPARGTAAIVRLYAIGYAINAAALSAIAGVGLLTMAKSGAIAASGSWMTFPMTLALLGCAIAAQRKRTRIHYRLQCSPGL